ncbi:hypothetical protein WA026_020805 [Henosepilachna vigintioctopunctata]|uniref:Uncharacterized protein n=1 Tax=Henosepilachna vigintioctopunctata TaxID=420089 RepID=A0AAW1U130_9CUCU
MLNKLKEENGTNVVHTPSIENLVTVIACIEEILNRKGADDERTSELINMREMLMNEISPLGQCSELKTITNQMKAMEIRSRMKEHMMQEDIKNIMKEDWPEEAFKTKTVTMNITDPKVDGNVLVIASVDKLKDLKYIRYLTEASRVLLKHIRAGKVKQGQM